MFRVIVLATLIAASPALAQESSACVERSEFLKHLSSNYDEAPVAMGLTSTGRVLEVIVSEAGSWTIIVTLPSGLSCGIASGVSWEGLLPPQLVDSGPKA